MTNKRLMRIAQAALMAGLCYVGFLIRIDIPIGADKTAIHMGNAFCVLAALLLGGGYGGLAGAVGMTIADLTTGYATSAPKTFVLKLCIGLIVGLIAHGIGKINSRTDKKGIFTWSLIGAIGGMAFNVIFDPLVGYLYKRFIFGLPEDLSSILLKWSAAATFINAITAVITAVILYCALRPALVRSGLLYMERKDKKN